MIEWISKTKKSHMAFEMSRWLNPRSSTHESVAQLSDNYAKIYNKISPMNEAGQIAHIGANILLKFMIDYITVSIRQKETPRF